eukprot:TRINITY_DN15206_c0_g1_i1.p2 TRINITY_DN15206_c0_g1~~TRINITY_DN15206_c0_g1_i1.p2  ORF type:complete len:153 (-),score=13.78 TRINITY_DN15206_c0_g1_i1:975-1433(-)
MDKVYQLSAEGIAFRFLPDPLQVKHAIQLRTQAGDNSKGFEGVPVFQSESLVLRSKTRRFCPIFFSKEDLDAAVKKAGGSAPAKQRGSGGKAAPAVVAVQVGSFEDVIKKLEANAEDSPWGDLVFVPPGRDVERAMGKALASGQGQGETVMA